MSQCVNPKSNANFSIVQGRTFSKSLTMYTDSTRSTPIDLTGATISGQVGLAGTDTAFTCSITSPATNGKFSISLSAAQTAAMKPGLYRYEVIVTWADATIQTLLYGNFVVVTIGD